MNAKVHGVIVSTLTVLISQGLANYITGFNSWWIAPVVAGISLALINWKSD